MVKIYYRNKNDACRIKETFERINVEDNEINFILTCADNNLDLAKFLYTNSKINIHTHDEAPFRLAVKNNSYDVIDWLWELSVAMRSKIDYRIYTDEAFRKACANGSLRLVKWLYDKGNINVNCKNDYAFRKICKYGYFELMKWLLSINKFININVMDGYALRMACRFGHCDVVEYLLDNYNYVNVHAKDNECYVYACTNGYLEIVKKLFEYCARRNGINNGIKIDIKICCHGGFRMACENNHLAVVEWLVNNLKSVYRYNINYNYKVKDGMIVDYSWR